VPVRNESQALPELLSALDHLLYPSDKLQVVVVDDGSNDETLAIVKRWTATRQNWAALPLAENVGKAQALNEALNRFAGAEVVAIYDADERPQPEALQRLVAPFADNRVGGVSGRRAVSNPAVSPAASYTTFEGLVHQLITMRAKDRLNLAPAILGANCAYRRSALNEVGGFRPGALLEDSDLTLKLACAGWQVRFSPDAISYHQVPETVRGYWRQHTRWARGFNDVAKAQATATLTGQRLSLALRLELFVFSLGYLDRVALLLGGGLALLPRGGHQPTRRRLVNTILLNVFTPFLQIIAALKIGRQPPAMYARMLWVPLFFGLDIAMATTGLWTTLRNIPQIWEERRVRQ
jgi:cellulose synthase/poly-beta-1,6-N-acetylglucosamine synthase-like glycosyltransferase